MYTVSDTSFLAGRIDSTWASEQFPAVWVALFFVGLLKFNLSFLPIVILALVFNFTNTIGYTYAVSSRDFLPSSSRVSTPKPLLTRLFSVLTCVALFGNIYLSVFQDRDAKRKWATGMAAGGMAGSMAGFGTSLVSGVAAQAVGKLFG